MIPSARSSDVAGLILAAGGSSRMPGQNKLLRPWSGGVLLEAAVSVAGEAGLSPIVVVVGSDAELIVSCLDRHEVIPLEHGRWSRGRASSLVAGLDRVAEFESVRAVVVLLGDEPGMSPDAIRAVVEEWRRGSADLVRMRYRDRPGHPVLLGPAARESALNLEGEVSVWSRLTASGLVGTEVAVDLPAPIDVDVPSALEAARAREDAASAGSGDPGRSD